ncbi:MAG: amylovoran biosynthesis protein AmsE [Sphingomonas sp.]|nr:MAG: amylovoran biosynthesis protein AmsE [Sphingomonas sp.]
MLPFSVLMSVYSKENSSNFRTSLESVYSQSLKPSEVIVVEDGPIGEDLIEVINEYSSMYDNFVVVKLAINGGLGKALNAGLARCSHEIVARMDSDDICVPHRFEKQVGLLSANHSLSLVGSAVAEFVDDPVRLEKVRRVPLSHEQIVRRFSTLCPVNHPSVVYRRSAVMACGGYAEEFVQEDYHLWAKMLSAGSRFQNLDEHLVLMRTGQGLHNRRGGWRYAVSEMKLQLEFYRLGLVSAPRLLFNASSRTVVRIMPANVRKQVYNSFLRKSLKV